MIDFLTRLQSRRRLSKDERFQNLLFYLFCGLLVGGFLYLFYASELRERIENKLYDLRIIVAPTLINENPVAVVGVDQTFLTSIEFAPQDQPDSPFRRLIAILKRIYPGAPKAIFVLLAPQIWPYDHPDMQQLVEVIRTTPNVYLGLFDALETSPDAVAPVFLPILDRLVVADLPRQFRRNVIREIAIAKDEGLPMVGNQLAKVFAINVTDELPRTHIQSAGDFQTMRLNYLRPDRVSHLSPAEDIAPGVLTERIVIVGYNEYKKWTLKQREATFVNSPWQSDGDEVGLGIPVVDLFAIAALNLIERAWLVPAPWGLNVLQTMSMILVAYYVWQFSVGIAAFACIIGVIAAIFIHALLMGAGRVYLPLADGLVFASLATIYGAMSRLRHEGKRRAVLEAKTTSEREVAIMQERFLDRLSSELQSINRRIHLLLKGHSSLGSGTGTVTQAYTKAKESCAELNEYLEGMQQFARHRSRSILQSEVAKFPVDPVISPIVRLYEQRYPELAVTIAGKQGAQAYGNATVCAQIVTNLVSNACKYSPKNGKVVVAVEPHFDRIDISVTDEGPGIAKEFQERIFEKFYRIKDDYVYKVKGHGLGLYLSQYFANQIGARVTVESPVQSGHGSKFVLSMPRRK